MKKEIVKILDKYTKAYGFISTTHYIAKRKQLNMQDRRNDFAFLNDYKSIITLGFPYPRKEAKWKGKGYGLLARFAYGTDYHKVIATILDEIMVELKNIGVTSVGHVDVDKVDEKFTAKLSGVGYYGKNSLIINPIYGNYILLSTILVDVDLHEPNVLDLNCGDCNLCVDACPSNALENGIDKTKCISYISQEKGELNEQEISYFKTMIYGCDICLKVCPKNKDIDLHTIAEFEPDGFENIPLQELLLMSNKGFKAKFGHNTSHWIGASTMRRNALCIIGNQKLVHLVPEIKKSMSVYHDNLWYNKTADIVLKMLERE